MTQKLVCQPIASQDDCFLLNFKLKSSDPPSPHYKYQDRSTRSGYPLVGSATGFRSIFSNWRPVGAEFNPNPIRVVLKLRKTRPTLTTPRTEQMFGPMPILVHALSRKSLDPGM